MPPDDQSTRFVLTYSTLPGFEGYPYWIPAENKVAPDTSGNASDPWTTFPDTPSPQASANGSARLAFFSGSQTALANMGDPWTAFPDWPPRQVRTYGSDPSAAYPEVLSHISASKNAGDSWSAFSDWPPAVQNFGDPRATFPDASPAFGLTRGPFAAFTRPAQTWANSSDSFAINRPALGNANDPWSAFPDWPPAGMQQQSRAADRAGTQAAANFYASAENDRINLLDLPALRGTAPATGAIQTEQTRHTTRCKRG
jgi:hypothetical protein